MGFRIVTLATGAALTIGGCGLIGADKPPEREPECCYNPPPPPPPPVDHAIPWSWDDTAPDPYEAEIRIEYDSNTIITFVRDDAGARLVAHAANGSEKWRFELPNIDDTVSVVRWGPTLYVAHYHRIATGARLSAVNVYDGNVVFTTQLYGIGPVSHSKWSNRIQLEIIDDRVVVFGRESGSDYVEVVDPSSGAILTTRLVAGDPVPGYAPPVGPMTIAQPVPLPPG